MSKTKCIIVDDEPLAIEVLKSHISKIDSFEIVGTCSDAIEAYDLLHKTDVDLMFLDINMPEMKGTDLVKTLKNPPAVVFTTAHREYAIESYNLNVLDYLLKPISFGRFLQTVEKYKQQSVELSEVTIKENDGDEAFIYLREKNVIHKIPVSEIVFVESFGDYLEVNTSGRKVRSRCTISSIEEALPDTAFIRIHRSFIVAIKQIQSFSPVMVNVKGHEFSIGSRYRETVAQKLDYDSFLNK
jgi:DNA-binding LytR/AlgR family response regulator